MIRPLLSESLSESPLYFIFRYKGDSVGRYRRYPRHGCSQRVLFRLGYRLPINRGDLGEIMFAWFMNLLSGIFGNTAKKNMQKDKDGNSPSGENWIGPDGVESGPGVSENWYLSYDGPAPVVEDIYEKNYGVERGNGAIPIEFYINKWGIPDGFGNTDYEKDLAVN